MKIVIYLLSVFILASCANLKDDKGNIVVSGYSLGRDILRNRKYKAVFNHPLTVGDILIVQEYNSWLAGFLVPGMTEVDLTETLSSSSNVKGFLEGLAAVGGTLIDGASKAL